MTGANWRDCFNLKISGICLVKKVPPKLGIKIKYWQPLVLAETVQKPGDSLVPVFGPLANVPGKALAQMIATGLSQGFKVLALSGSLPNRGQVGASFAEVHLYPYPLNYLRLLFPKIWLPCGWKGKENLYPYWFSELDWLNWRVAADILNVQALAWYYIGVYAGGFCHGEKCMGFWGPLFPRRGYIYGASPPVVSAALVYRAYNWASRGKTAICLSRPPKVSKKDIKLQMVYPKVSGCIRIGENPIKWEHGKLSMSGRYAWIVWVKRSCCVSVLKFVVPILNGPYVEAVIAALNAMSYLEDASLVRAFWDLTDAVTSKMPSLADLKRILNRTGGGAGGGQ